MRALDRKLWRDLRWLWSQALTIALVVASAVAGLLTTLSAVNSLAQARDDFYAQARFADVFVQLRRAPRSVLTPLEQLPGVAQVQASLERGVRVFVPGVSDPVQGWFIGLSGAAPRALNRVSLRSGDAPGQGPVQSAPGSPGALTAQGEMPVWVAESFAQARQLRRGSRLQALVNGRQRSLVIQGLGLSPEYIFSGRFGMPDPGGFGVFWVDEALLEAAFDMRGVFTHAALRLAPGASESQVIESVQSLLAPWGAREAHGRDRQTSHLMLDNEIKEQHLMGTLLPAIFMAVAAFLLNVVVSRLVSTQREQIATLKALGYDNPRILAHYLQLVGLITLAGWLLGLAAGKVLGGLLTGLYAEFFRFPRFDHALGWALPALALLLAGLAAAGGTFHAIRSTVRLSPAEAMRPPSPAHYRPSVVERLGGARWPLTLRMILRQIERRPWRATLAMGGVAAAVAIVILGNFFRDAIQTIVDTQFQVALRADVQVWVQDSVPEPAQAEMLRQPGVWKVEGQRYVPVNLVHGHRSYRTQLRGLDPDAELHRLVDLNQAVRSVTGEGLILTDRLARKLDVAVGQTLRVEVMEGAPRQLTLRVDGTVREMMGLSALMRRDALHRVLGESPAFNSLTLGVERGREGELLAAMNTMPRVAGAFSKAIMLRNMEALSARNIRIMSLVMTVFAAVIAVGVVYNQARIALSERRWELASLRVLGFTRQEVSALLLGELALILLAALPLGMLLGRGLVGGIIGALASDQFEFPVVVLPRTYAWAALCVLVAALGSAWVVRRRVDRLDLVAALKTRE